MTDLFPLDLAPLAYEQSLWNAGHALVAGVDEAGRGALAGPVVAAAVILSDRSAPLIGKVKDSKKLSEEKRELYFDLVHEHAVCIGVGIVQPNQIDEMNILRASLHAMKLAVESLSPVPSLCLVDGNAAAPLTIPQRLIVKGDDRILSIGAASIIAKVTRDRIMRDLDTEFPAYGFAVHKGYGTEVHLKAIQTNGPTPVHRKSFNLGLRSS